MAAPELDVATQIQALISTGDVHQLHDLLIELTDAKLTDTLERLSAKHRAIVYRMLPKGQALEIFESFSPALRADLIKSLQAPEVTAIFADLDPDDRVWLLDELPAALAPRLLRGLSGTERALTSAMLGYPQNSVGRRMSPEYVSVRDTDTAAAALSRVQTAASDTESVYLIPVLNDARIVLGVLTLRHLLAADPNESVAQLFQQGVVAAATDDAEAVARQALTEGAMAVPITDSEGRLVGVLTIDDAARILEDAESEDAARQGGAEPLRRPYFATSVLTLVRSRVVWLLVLAVGATLTVQVLERFESTLEQVTMLALFVPLVIGTGGNTGNQAATTLTRALALSEVRVRDVWRVLAREVRVGFLLGLTLGSAAFLIAGLVYSWTVGAIIGLTLVTVCTMAAGVGGGMPLVAKKLNVDPAVFSNPFITTFVDAAGLVLYFLIAQAVLL